LFEIWHEPRERAQEGVVEIRERDRDGIVWFSEGHGFSRAEKVNQMAALSAEAFNQRS
jgi:hypothetical protein